MVALPLGLAYYLEALVSGQGLKCTGCATNPRPAPPHPHWAAGHPGAGPARAVDENEVGDR